MNDIQKTLCQHEAYKRQMSFVSHLASAYSACRSASVFLTGTLLLSWSDLPALSLPASGLFNILSYEFQVKNMIQHLLISELI